MKIILRKNKCLAAINEMPTKVTDDSKWDEMDGNAIANLHLALADGVLSSIYEKKSAKEIWDHLARFTVLSDYLVFDDVAAIILEEENRRNNMEDKQTSSSRWRPCHFKKGCRGLNISNRQGNVVSTLEDGDALCCEAVVTNEGMQRFADVWLFDTGATFHMTARREWFHQYKPIAGRGSVYRCNDNKLKIIRIESIMVKMHDGTVHTIRDVRRIEGLKRNLVSLGQLMILVASPSHRVAVTWHQKLGHMSEQGMKILVERKLLHGLTNVSLPLCEHCVISKQHHLKLKTSNSRSVSLLKLVHSDVWQAPAIRDQKALHYSIHSSTNGVAERMNRTLLEIARAMLAVKLKTPMEMWTRKPVKYSDLHIFGGHVYVMYNSQENTKFDPKSRKCLFLGSGKSNVHDDMYKTRHCTFSGSSESVMAEPGREHWKAVKRILRYIKGTSDVALCFRESNLIFKGYVDSDYVGDLDISKSTIGYVFKLCGETVSWVSKLQSVVAMSTTEAEYVTVAQASK
ncbi:gag-pol polyprotein [Tanacetum coccineum]